MSFVGGHLHVDLLSSLSREGWAMTVWSRGSLGRVAAGKVWINLTALREGSEFSKTVSCPLSGGSLMRGRDSPCIEL